MSLETFDKILDVAERVFDAVFAIAAKAAKAAAVGAGIAGLTYIANAAPSFGAQFDLNPAATGQVAAFVLLARDALKTKGG
jgi:hypothetical protein